MAFITFKWLRGPSANWTAKNPVLDSGEPGLETDTRKFKIGDGVSRWDDLDYYLDENGVSALIDDAILAGGGAGADARVGDMTELTTTVKSTIVEAINEINTPVVSFVARYNNAKAG